jgi:hypothetical protein
LLGDDVYLAAHFLAFLVFAHLAIRAFRAASDRCLGYLVTLIYREHTQDKLLFPTQQTLFLQTIDASGSGYLRKLLIEATPLHRLNISKEAVTASSPL